MSLNQVFLQDPLKAFRRDFAVPHPVGIDHQPRPARADSQTGGFGAHDFEAGFLEALLDGFPRVQAVFRAATIRAGAEENVPLRIRDSRLGKARADLFTGGFQC